MIITLVLLWLGSSILAASIAFAFFQGEFPTIAQKSERNNWWFSVVWGLVGGPIALVEAFFLSGRCKHGARLW